MSEAFNLPGLPPRRPATAPRPPPTRAGSWAPPAPDPARPRDRPSGPAARRSRTGRWCAPCGRRPRPGSPTCWPRTPAWTSPTAGPRVVAGVVADHIADAAAAGGIAPPSAGRPGRAGRRRSATPCSGWAGCSRWSTTRGSRTSRSTAPTTWCWCCPTGRWMHGRPGGRHRRRADRAAELPGRPHRGVAAAVLPRAPHACT